MAYVNSVFNRNFLEYASYVIKDRAIPHIDDGLKPVQRRILHSLFEMDDGKFHKVANVVGHCMRYHPHGDASIYSALVVLANKDLFIDKQGNFGNIYTGDDASASRYIECRINELARQLIYKPEITEYDDSYDGRNREPVVFPAKIPLVLIHGAEGIAVGMSTRVLPHNFIEVLQAMVAALEGQPFTLHPDFLTAGLVDVSDYQDGLGKVLVRARLDTSDPKRIVIRELPYGSTTESLIASIENAARKNKIKIAGINDFTTEHVEIEIKLARGITTADTIDALFAFTDCENSISVNLLVIRDNTPVILSVTEVVEYHARRLVAILTAELELERGKLLDRLHARTLEQIFVEERIYKQIEEQTTHEAVFQAVYRGFEPFRSQIRRKITDEDIERLLRIPIRRISLYDINKARQEMKEIRERLGQIKTHLADINGYAVGFLETVIEGQTEHHPRRTEITSFEKVDVREAARRNLALRYDADTGYLGYALTSGKMLFDVSIYDRILVVRRSGVYSVIRAPEKLFVDKGMLVCGHADKQTLTQRVFTVLYKNAKGTYLKRCRIEGYILDKGYQIVPDGSEPLKVTTKEDVNVVLKYKPLSKYKVLEERFAVSDYLIKSARAAGVRLSNKELKSALFESGAASAGAGRNNGRGAGSGEAHKAASKKSAASKPAPAKGSGKKPRKNPRDAR
ncbi:MAG: DNA topoisomerase IV subunit A [Spirochaetaceae bacterium]|nr:MAG: DNA topoisomerase IV subunit A [Spirochaetaceae bacterium]